MTETTNAAASGDVLKEAVRLAHATLASVTAFPDLLQSSPVAVIADVLSEPPWSLDWHEAFTFVGTVLRQEERK